MGDSPDIELQQAWPFDMNALARLLADQFDAFRSSQMSRLLIAGCGYIGSALGVELAESGHTVFGLRRRRSGLPGGIRPIEADLNLLDTLSNLPPRLDFVFYTVGSDDRSDDAYRRAYVTGLSHLLTALSQNRQNPRRIFFASSTGVYHQRHGEWVDELSPTQPHRDLSRRLLEAESLLRKSPVAETIVRFGGIYGPGRASLIDRVRSGKATYPSTHPQYTNRIHRDDCVGILSYLMTLDHPASLYLGVDDDPAEKRVILNWLAERLGAPPPRPRAGNGGRRGNKRCRNKRLRQAGYRFRFPSFREGYGAMLGVERRGRGA